METPPKDDQRRLADLLQITRTGASHEKVTEILQSSAPLNEKIQKIERIDHNTKNRKKAELSRSTSDQAELVEHEESLEDEEENADPLIYERKPQNVLFKRNQEKLKMPPRTISFIQYLFYDLRKIKSFSLESKILDFTFLGFRFQFKKNVKEQLEKNIQMEIIPPLTEALNYAEKKGWLVLTKWNYNLLMILKELCDHIQEVPFVKLDFASKYLLNKIHGIERTYLVLYKIKDSLNILNDSLRKVIKGNPELLKKEDRIIKSLVRLLSPKAISPCLRDFILGANMIRQKRFLTIDELINQNVGELIDSEDFHCPPPVKEEVVAYLNKGMEELRPLFEKKRKLIEVKNFIPGHNQSNAEATIQELFQKAPSKLSIDYDKDKENLIRFFSRFSIVFRQSIAPYLQGNITLEGEGRKAIFAQSFFDAEITRITMILDRIERTGLDFPQFSMHRYQAIKKTSRGAISQENDLVHQIDDLMVAFVQIGYKLKNLLGNRAEKPEDATETLDYPLQGIVLRKTNYHLQDLDTFVIAQGFFENLTLLEVFLKIISLCFSLGIFFQESSLNQLLGSENKVDKEVSLILSRIERIAHNNTYRRILKKYGGLLPKQE